MNQFKTDVPEISEDERERIARLQGLAEAIAQKRAEAIEARQMSGIEEEWLEDEEHYEGIDDVNRGEMSAWNSKPPGQTTEDDGAVGSTVFVNITRPYCDAAGASLADMLLPTDDNSWSLDPTPVPELIPFTKGEMPEAVRQSIRAESPDENFAAETEARMVDKAKSMLGEAKEKADKAQRRIEDWHVECQYHAEVRKVIEDAARIGSGVLKGPIPQKRKHVAYMEGQLVIEEEIKPGSQWISYRNLYPAKGCGENIHNGSYIFERDDISSKQLRQLVGVPGYLQPEIMEVLGEGPKEAEVKHKDVNEMRSRSDGMYEIWYFHGEIERDDLEAVFGLSGYDCEEELPDVVPAQLTLVNNRVIRAVLNPLDSGDFPYDVMVWQRRKGLPWGIGVARHIRTPQRIINAAWRRLMDNAGLAGGPMWWLDTNLLIPYDGVVEMVPGKCFIPAAEASVGSDLSKAIGYAKLDMFVNELNAVISMALKMAEDVTGLPMLLQGQMGAQKLNTLGQTEILNNNANIVRRRIARLFDDLVTEPHIRRYYNYLLQYGEDDEKGEFVIEARGSSNLVERAIEKQKTDEYLNLAANPVYGIDPKKAMRERLRSDKLDPKNWEYDDEEWQAVVQNMSQPQQSDPREAIAQLNAETKAAMQERELAHKEKMKAAEIQAEERIAQARTEIEQAIAVFEGDLKKELAEMKYQGDKDIQFDQLKTRLNETVMKLTTQKELSASGARAKNMPQPPTEPHGRARVGRSFEE